MFRKGGEELAAGVLTDKAAVKVLAGDDVRSRGGYLRVEVLRAGIHEPGKTGRARAAPGQTEHKHGSEEGTEHPARAVGKILFGRSFQRESSFQGSRPPVLRVPGAAGHGPE